MGDLLILTGPQIERFWSRVQKGGPDDCWPWTGARNPTGYGTVTINGIHIYTHRLAWALSNGKTLRQCITLTCHHRECCNPNHLLSITRRQLTNLMYKRGHGHKSSVTDEECQEAYDLLSSHPCRVGDLAILFGRTRKTLYQRLRAYCKKRGLKLPHSRSLEPLRARLSWLEVCEIRERYAQGGITMKQLGVEYGVSESQVSYIISGKRRNPFQV